MMKNTLILRPVPFCLFLTTFHFCSSALLPFSSFSPQQNQQLCWMNSKGNSSTATLQRFSLLSPSSFFPSIEIRDENLMIMVRRWKALKNVKAEIVFQSRINWLGHMTLGTKEDCLGNISISICRLKKAGFLSFLLVWLNLKSLPRSKGLSGLSLWKHPYIHSFDVQQCKYASSLCYFCHYISGFVLCAFIKLVTLSWSKEW